MSLVLGGTRSLLREARDDEERRGVRRFRLVASLTVVAFALGFPVGAALTQSWREWSAINFVLFIATLALLYTVWLPRILKRRFDAEMRAESVRALTRRRHERRVAIVGWTLGLTCGTLGPCSECGCRDEFRSAMSGSRAMVSSRIDLELSAPR